MPASRRNFPAEYKTIVVENTVQSQQFPLILKRLGYLNDKKLTIGSDIEMDDVLILYSLDGVAEFFKNRDLKYLTANDVVVSACHYPMKFRSVSAKRWECFYVVVSGAYATYFYNLVRPGSGIVRVDPLSGVLDCFSELLEINYDGSLLSYMRSSTKLNDLFTELYQISLRVNQSKKALPPRDTYVNAALRYIAEHFKEGITVDDVCGNIGFSKHYFCRVFKENTGMTIHRYINESRINRAKELLSYSKLSVATIATEMGFKNTLTFIRNFKAYTNMTPSEYRQNF